MQISSTATAGELIAWADRDFLGVWVKCAECLVWASAYY